MIFRQGIVLKVKNLNVDLGKERILENLSFEVKEGEVLTILGPNGAGKTVLLKTLLGILPYKGKIEWMPKIRIGYVPQRLPFIKDIPLSVEEFFELKNVSEKEIKDILKSIGLEKDILGKKIGDLSSGQFQRILVGWALASNPRVLLFDEPMTGIDIGGQESIYEFLAKLKKERDLTILLVTHDLSIVYKLATDCLCLNKKMLCYSIPKDLTTERLSQLYGGEIKFYQHNHE
ncbi:MAG: ABC transporter ATP-binding protein [Candidatus Nealsonbacteria bacterium CG08_land_8_20_14_0_20_38_20]|uniref:ABC transporter ATP-binding protein n=1 Tax=Candidatus Nealsonbacteria bacterium CG08_land_8_20_14_0_20_38_20 TaxID=1974705 RepID=A0A2H0YM31_9BACT|nr:MAG: ABC transporter ATP-binding protein [Candidatus Nealsonbacteria bacterium CG08_land_8_20_14_0_20_38_20]